MSTDHQSTIDGPDRPANIVVLLRESYLRLNDLVITRLEREGHDAVRPAHAAVFQFLDDGGTTVSTLAQRARMTKQAMAQLVQHLETHGYVSRVPDPGDRRAKLVIVTERGQEVFDIAQGLVPEIEALVTGIVGEARTRAMRVDLEAIRRADLAL
jgi:DNA-binding MarR family transcriptional regulator